MSRPPPTPTSSPSSPARALALVDLTSLDADDDEAVVRDLCDRATTPAGRVAAVCIMPAFTALAAERLRGTTIRVATVANFPAGDPDPDGAAARGGGRRRRRRRRGRRRRALARLGRRRPEVAVALVRACRQACGEARLKVILEAGELPRPGRGPRPWRPTRCSAGAHFVKTSTGKVGVGRDARRRPGQCSRRSATRAAAGFKAAGGVRTTEQAAGYLALADEVLGEGWAMPETFRIGASGLVDDLLRHLAG